jgi:hypothetical protein
MARAGIRPSDKFLGLWTTLHSPRKVLRTARPNPAAGPPQMIGARTGATHPTRVNTGTFTRRHEPASRVGLSRLGAVRGACSAVGGWMGERRAHAGFWVGGLGEGCPAEISQSRGPGAAAHPSGVIMTGGPAGDGARFGSFLAGWLGPGRSPENDEMGRPGRGLPIVSACACQPRARCLIREVSSWTWS